MAAQPIPVLEPRSVTGTGSTPSAQGSTLRIGEIERQLIHGRAFEAVIWGMPAVNYDAMYQALVRDARGVFNQMVYWSRPSDWKNQTLTPNTEVLYVIPFINTKIVGPMVLEIPPADHSSIAGCITDFWQKALEDVGPSGADKGQGGKYVMLPPAYAGQLPRGYIAVPCEVYRSFALLSCVPGSGDDADVAEAANYLKRIKIYPLSQAAMPPKTAFIDARDIVFDATIPYDLRFFQSLNRMVQLEPWLERDKRMIDLLRSIGIEKGREFKPDPELEEILESAIQEGRIWLLEHFLNSGTAYYPGKHWRNIVEPFAVKSEFAFESPTEYAADMRGVLYYWLFSGTKSCFNLAAAQTCLITHKDREGRLFEGGASYRLNVPASVPVGQYWSVTVYDIATHSLIREMPWGNRSSLTPGFKKNVNGSADIYFGPKPPKGKEMNWVPTKPGGNYEVIWRFFGPQKAALDKTWQLPDIEKSG